MTGSQREAINLLMMMESVTVNADLIAQALGMNPGVLRRHVKDGDYKISKYEVCGDRVRFFRKDFLQQIGEIPMDPPERTEMAVMEDILRQLVMVCDLLDEQNDLLHAIHDPIRPVRKMKKAAGAATPTD